MTTSSFVRVAQVTCAIIWCLLAAGPVFGFAALKPVLIAQGVYSDKCNVSAGEFTELPCSEQDLSLNLMFTVACMVTNICALPVGFILDTYGPRVTGVIGSIILFFGSLTMAYAPYGSIIDFYLAGYTLLALGGPFVFISCFQLANTFPQNSGVILALITSAFDTSSALFLGYRLIYTNYFELSVTKFFIYYMTVPVFIFLCQVTFMPSTSYKTVGTLAKIAETAIDETGMPLDASKRLPEDRDVVVEGTEQPSMSETTALLMRRASMNIHEPDRRRGSNSSRASTAKSVYEQDADDKLYEQSGGVYGVMHNFGVYDQLKSPWFWLMAIFTTIQMLRINYFVATVRAQELFLYKDPELASSINHIFDLALPLGGVISIPIVGYLLDNYTTLNVLAILVGTSFVVGVLGLLTWLPGTYAGILLLCVYRPFYYTSVSDYCAKVFGFETFGTVYGMVISIAGACNGFQQVLDRIVHLYFGMNPTPVNAVLTAVSFLGGAALLYYVRSQEKEMKRRNLELEAQNATAQTIPH